MVSQDNRIRPDPDCIGLKNKYYPPTLPPTLKNIAPGPETDQEEVGVMSY